MTVVDTKARKIALLVARTAKIPSCPHSTEVAILTKKNIPDLF